MHREDAPPRSRPGRGAPRPARVRLALLLLLLACWFLPWADVTGEGGATVREAGPERTGAVAAGALLALWGLGLTALLAREDRDIRLGAALTDAAVALAAAGLLLAEHPWLPGVEESDAYVPIFGPLALLAALDAGVLLRSRRPSRDVAVIRAAAGIFAAGALIADRAWLVAGVALWLGAGSALLARATAEASARRPLHVLLLAASLVALLAPELNASVAEVRESTVTWAGSEAWRLASALLALLALHGLWRSGDAGRWA